MRRRRFTRRSGRRSGGVRQFTAPKRWEAANFETRLQLQVPQDPILGATVMIELAAHPEHVGDATTGQGQTLTDLVSKFEIGGVVFDIEVLPVDVVIGDQVTLIHFTEFLCTIGLDQSGLPVTVPDFFQNQKPVAIAGVNNIIANDVDFPTRVHYRSSWSEHHPHSDSSFFNAANSHRIRSTKSIRLRRFLDSRQGLYLGVCALQNQFAIGEVFVRFAGTLYYRVRF